ncbi:MAG: hypothetical protein GY757_15670 [bacterium]|nr:hypothetical protein [bacterium]
MIPLHQQPEPPDFKELVEIPGNRFLDDVPAPTYKQWKNHDYWTKTLTYTREVYEGLCAYSSLWISPNTGSPTIDHFEPKSSQPRLAYKWSNYRYASLKFNNRKGTKKILDPFDLEPDWFILNFSSLLVRPNPGLSPETKTAVQNTIDTLKLNEDDLCVECRQDWLMDYCNGEITFKYLQKKAPFIAYELQRQRLVKSIASMLSGAAAI